MNKPGVVLSLAREVSMFAIIKSFVKKGIKVTVCDYDLKSPGFFIPGVHEKLISPDPEIDAAGFLDFLINLGRRAPGNVLLVDNDSSSQLISDHRNELRKYFLFLAAESEINDIGDDKAKTAEAAAKYGLPIPKTFSFSSNETDIKQIEIDFPLVLKPRKSHGSLGQYVVHNSDELAQTVNIIKDKKSEYIAQEWIPGDVKNLCNFTTIFDENSQPKGIFTIRKLNVLTSERIEQGIATYYLGEKIPEIIESSIEFLKSIKWQGLAELEFKYDARDSKYKIFEINPRVWAWIRLPMECGVDFPGIYYDLLCGKHVSPVTDFRAGVTYLRSVVDAYSALYKLRKGEVNFLSFSSDLIHKYAKAVFRSKDNIVEDLPWRNPNFHWIRFYLKKLDEYG
jgi:predicted ATP-grasp superfamily ATP-dependent carboligase